MDFGFPSPKCQKEIVPGTPEENLGEEASQRDWKRCHRVACEMGKGTGTGPGWL